MGVSAAAARQTCLYHPHTDDAGWASENYETGLTRHTALDFFSFTPETLIPVL